ncbi:tissue factor pathway inhibitor 2-like [Rhipicephalus sanguineus]|uniref:tissue factor pathway inhibitor 2-like n=1 Tax=Rhipicephalus sanguineus TaxID=34632 RepID=UPI001895A142|nr:tissue factor pathway inhibitor 2-like [Rhipicephalus sanguineus]
MRSLYSSCLFLVLSVCGVNGFQVLGQLTRKPPRRIPLCCLKPPFNATCQPITSTWYFDQKARVCRQISPGLCNRGSNSFASHVKCMEACKPPTKVMLGQCLKPAVLVRCSALRHAWYYDFPSRSCKMFSYLNCGATCNVFLTELKCQWTCNPRMKPKPLCSADPEPDQCMLKRRYVFFDFRRDVCLEFPKKRCGKGHNSFASFQQCFNTCSCLQEQVV